MLIPRKTYSSAKVQNGENKYDLLIEIFGYLLIVFSILAPIYWVPYVDVFYIRYVKSIALLFIFVASIMYFTAVGKYQKSYQKIHSSSNIKNVFLCYIFSFISLLFTQSVSSAVDKTDSYLYLMMYIFSMGMFSKFLARKKSIYALKLLLFVYVLISIMIIMAGNKIISDYQVPIALLEGRNENAFKLVDYGLSVTGLGGSRTGWGAALAVASSMILSLLNWRSSIGKFAILITLISTYLALYQMGARGAFIAFSAGFISAININVKSSNRYIIYIIAFMLVIVFYSNISIDDRFYFDLNGMDLDSALNAVTSNRYETWAHGVSSFLSSPIYGVGVDASRFEGRLAVHNTWIEIASESGVLGLVPALLILINLIKTVKINNSNITSSANFSPAIISGIIISMVEPGFPLGAFFNTTVFWLAVMMQQSHIQLAVPRRL